jgi:hypothetical protein
MRAVEFITEAFNQPYPLQWEPGDHGDVDALATLGDGNYLSIMFNHEGDNEWHVEFYRNNSVGVTGEGDAQRVFATVLSAMQQFIQKQQPKQIVFSANKDVEPGQNSESRAKLYNSLVARYAKAWGYDASNQDHGHEVIYELTRLKQDVTELFNPKGSYPLHWDNTWGPAERHAQARYGDNWLDINFVPNDTRPDIVEVDFSKNDRWDVTGTGDEYKTFTTVLNAFSEYLRGYQPKIIYFSSKGKSRTRLYQSLINRLAQSYGYKQFDMSKLSQEARDKIGLLGDDILVLRKSYDQQGVAEGSEQKYLWHGSRQKIDMLEPRQSVDTGGAAGSNQNAIYATSDPKVAIAMGLTTPGSDTGMFPNDPQMVLFSGKIRKGENVYLHKLPIYGSDNKPQFVQGGSSREFHSVPGVKGIKPIEIKTVPVDKHLNLIRTATPQDLEMRKKYMKQSMAEGTADDINKMFGNMFDPNYAALQRVALLAMQGRQDEAMSHLSRVIKDADPNAQKKIMSAVNDIKPVTINGKVADSSTLDKSEQHQQWIKKTFIPWVESLL